MDMGSKTHEASGRPRGSGGSSSVDDLLRSRELLERERKLAEREQSLLDRERNANRHRPNGGGVKGRTNCALDFRAVHFKNYSPFLLSHSEKLFIVF